jgi:hypothetical protein
MDCETRKVALAFAFLACRDFIATKFDFAFWQNASLRARRTFGVQRTAPYHFDHCRPKAPALAARCRHSEIAAIPDRAWLVPDI